MAPPVTLHQGQIQKLVFNEGGFIQAKVGSSSSSLLQGKIMHNMILAARLC